MLRLTIFITLCLAAGTVHGQTVAYVDDTATVANNGSSWCDAYIYLQDALAAVEASGGAISEVRVAQGTYKPDQGASQTPGDRMATFQLIDGVAIKGGYAGCGEVDPDAQNVTLYETVLSGDLTGDDGPDFENNDENSYHVVTGAGMDATSVLERVTISSGNANGTAPYRAGGGMYNGGNSSPTLEDCTFSANSAYYGGGMFNGDCSPTLNNCTFSGNRATYNGGGIYNDDESGGTLTNCTFNANSADNGGGMYNVYFYDLTVMNCTFSANAAAVAGGGMYNYGYSDATVANCTFVDNMAPNGRALACDSNEQSAPSDVHMNNCILWNGGDEIWNNDGSTVTITYSDVQGGLPAGTIDGGGNIDGEPELVDVDGGNLRLSPGSPCIDAADNAAVPPDALDLDGDGDTDEPIPFDLDGNPRFVDDPGTTDTGNGTAPIVDMGAYEFQGDTSIPAVSQWGVAIMSLLVLGAGTVIVRPRTKDANGRR